MFFETLTAPFLSYHEPSFNSLGEILIIQFLLEIGFDQDQRACVFYSWIACLYLINVSMLQIWYLLIGIWNNFFQIYTFNRIVIPINYLELSCFVWNKNLWSMFNDFSSIQILPRIVFMHGSVHDWSKTFWMWGWILSISLATLALYSHRYFPGYYCLFVSWALHTPGFSLYTYVQDDLLDFYNFPGCTRKHLKAVTETCILMQCSKISIGLWGFLKLFKHGSHRILIFPCSVCSLSCFNRLTASLNARQFL